MNKRQLKSEIVEENVIYSGNANHNKGIESVGGKLYLTSGELIFESHKFNVQTHIFKIQVTGINEIKCSFFPPNAFEFLDNDGKKEKFIVNGRKKWISKIEELKK